MLNEEAPVQLSNIALLALSPGTARLNIDLDEKKINDQLYRVMQMMRFL
jgi:hypothetical protein